MTTFAYAPRPIRPLEPLVHGDWRLKVYGIAADAEAPRSQLELAARDLAVDALSRSTPDGAYGVGFLGIHDGRGECFVFLDWWADENELHHVVWTSPVEDPTRFTPQRPDGAIACVWDLAVIGHERTAWLRHVLASPTPNFDDYLGDLLSAEV